MARPILSLLVLGLIAWVMWQVVDQPSVQAQASTPTPLPLAFPTPEPMATSLEMVASPIPTFTPTEPGPPVLQLREGVSELNIRAEAEPTAEILGVISPGEQYEVLGQFFLWYQIRYEGSRAGSGFVFGELVEIIGDPARIPDLTQVTATPPLPPEIVGPTLTNEAILSQPGGELTLTANLREIEAPGEPAASGPVNPDEPRQLDLPTREIQPTFTYPSDVIAQAATAESGQATPMPERISTGRQPDGLAPVVPIVVLFGLGTIFFLLSLLQR
jgi:hypothetical protein